MTKKGTCAKKAQITQLKVPTVQNLYTESIPSWVLCFECGGSSTCSDGKNMKTTLIFKDLKIKLILLGLATGLTTPILAKATCPPTRNEDYKGKLSSGQLLEDQAMTLGLDLSQSEAVLAYI